MKRLAIVADRTSVADAFRLVLRQTTGFKLVGVVDGRYPVPARLRITMPEVVLVDDMQDPENSLARIREIAGHLPDSKIIFLTTQLDQPSASAAVSAGADAVVSKSIHPVSLATLLRETANDNIFHSQTSLKSSGGRVSHPRLTSRELEILRLAAAGQTNDQIARTLWVTQKTVKFHLSNTYRKLGVNNRTEAAHYAHTNDLLRERQRIAS
jgi:DNA-binding NarL/FixJ family response regulator